MAGAYRIENPTVNTATTAAALLETAEKNGIVINRITETYGMFRHTAAEIKEYCRVCHDHGVELMMSTGPRATYDTGATVLSAQGARIGYRLRGMEQVLRGVEDIKRGYDLGVRAFLIYDEGMLWLAGQMRKDGALPKEIIFKVSAHLGHCNPCSFKLMESLGADSINPVRDLQIPMIAALRQAVTVPLDVHTDNPPGSGGFIRVYEAPEIVRVAAPLHCKTGNSVVSGHGEMTSAADGRRWLTRPLSSSRCSTSIILSSSNLPRARATCISRLFSLSFYTKRPERRTAQIRDGAMLLGVVKERSAP